MATNGAVFEVRSRKDSQVGNRANIRPSARLDVVELATCIGKDSVLAASRFLDASEATIEFLAKSPQSGAVYPSKNERLHGLHAFRMAGPSRGRVKTPGVGGGLFSVCSSTSQIEGSISGSSAGGLAPLCG